MGVKIGEIIPGDTVKVVSLEDLSGRVVAFDAFNMLYQFLANIRGADGKPLMDSKGRVTSHLSGLFFRMVNLMEVGIKPVMVYDGRPPELKMLTVVKRQQERTEARRLYEEALEAGRVEEARAYAQRAAQLEDYMVESSKELLKHMGIPFVVAPSEGEAQAAHMASKGDVYCSASQDMDSLLFGSPRLARNLSIVGRRKLPKRKEYVEIYPEIIELEEVMRKLGVTREQLIDIGILVGTDYWEGVKGIGPKKALKLIKEMGSIEPVLRNLGVRPEISVEAIREAFLKPQVTDEYKLEWRDVDDESLLNFLCGEHDFSEERVKKAIGELKQAIEKKKKETSLDAWFQ